MFPFASRNGWPFAMLAWCGQGRSRAVVRSWVRLGVYVMMGIMSLQATVSASVMLKAVVAPWEVNEVFETSEEETPAEERSEEEAAAPPVRSHRAVRQIVLRSPLAILQDGSAVASSRQVSSLGSHGDEHSRRNGVGAPLRC